jgi:hypothetical protein
VARFSFPPNSSIVGGKIAYQSNAQTRSCLRGISSLLPAAKPGAGSPVACSTTKEASAGKLWCWRRHRSRFRASACRRGGVARLFIHSIGGCFSARADAKCLANDRVNKFPVRQGIFPATRSEIPSCLLDTPRNLGAREVVSYLAALTLVWPFPAREAEPSAADFYFGNSVGGAGAALEPWGRCLQQPRSTTALHTSLEVLRMGCVR